MAMAKCRSRANPKHPGGDMHTAIIRKSASIAAVTAALLFLLFDVTVAPRWQLPGEVSLPDPEQEAHFSSCYDERDRRIHELAFGTIDNPDVQREFIASRRDEAEAACRQRFPQRFTSETLPFEFNLIDLDFRFD